MRGKRRILLITGALGGALVLGLAGCTGESAPAPTRVATGTQTPTPTPTPELTSADVLTQIDALVADWAAQAATPDASAEQVTRATGAQTVLSTIRDTVASTPDIGASDLATHLSQAQALDQRARAGEELGSGLVIDGSASVRLLATQPAVDESEFEAFAQAYVPEPDATGSYITAAVDLAAAFGVAVDSEDLMASDGCLSAHPPTPGDEPTTPNSDRGHGTMASTCSPDSVIINRSSDRYLRVAFAPHIVDVMKHELAHVTVLRYCDNPAFGFSLDGTTDLEIVATAYAATYLGADAEWLLNPDDNGIVVDPSRWEAAINLAQNIHDHNCD